jgi:MFS family permease
VAVLSPVIPREMLRSRQFLGSSLANLLVGGGLMVALVDIPIMGRGVFNLDQLGSALLLARFMIAVPVGAVAGGFLALRLGGRWTAVLGLAAAAGGFLLLSRWEANELSRHVGPLREADLVLVLTGLGFGIVIAPLAAAVLDVARAERHGLAASLVVLVRTLGMLVGLSGLTAYGLHRFYELFNQGPPLHLIPGSPDFAAQKAAFDARVTTALVAEYHGIFLIAAVLCAAAGTVALLTLSARRTAESTTVSR